MSLPVLHVAQARPISGVNASKPLQTEFPFLASCPRPVPAPRADVLKLESEAQAVRLSLGNRKRSAVAATLGISAGMLSLCAKGERRIPDRLLLAFSYLTGTTLLAQYRELQEALAAMVEQTALERRWAASLPRSVA